jgi:cell division protein FtsA
MLVCGLDVGTSAIRAVLAQYKKGEHIPTILATAHVASYGLRDGYIVDADKVRRSISLALQTLEKQSGQKIRHVGIACAGAGLASHIVHGMVVVTRADLEVTGLDVSKVLREARGTAQVPNEKIIHTIPLAFKLDGKEVLGDPVGLVGTKLEVRALVVSVHALHIERLIEGIGSLGVEISSIVASPLSASIVCLSEKQKVAGCALVNIGSETVTTGVFENGAMISLLSIPLGSLDITNDIALGLKVPIDEAEGIKIGTLISSHPKKKLDEIVSARLTDIFELLNKHLKKIGRQALLPAGTILIGGGARLHEALTIAKEELKLPVETGVMLPEYEEFIRTKDPVWYTAIGVCLYENPGTAESYPRDTRTSSTKTSSLFKSFIRQFLPICFLFISGIM